MHNQICTIYLVRHGETEWNALGKVQGHSDIVLSTKGIAQAQARWTFFQDKQIAAAFSSDLSRAIQTAEILNPHLKVTTSPDLREQSWGIWEGHTFESLKERFGHGCNAYTGNPVHIIPEVESHVQIIKRVQPFLEKLALDYAQKEVMVISHGGVMKALLYHLNITDLFEHSFENLGILKLQATPAGLKFVEVHGMHIKKSVA